MPTMNRHGNVPHIAAYKYDESFFIARDKIFCEKLIVSQKFVDICNEEKIYIDFIDTAI